ERHALNARVKIDAAAGTTRVQRDIDREQIPAAGASEDLVRAHQGRRLRSALVLQLTPRRALLRRARRFWSLRAARPTLVLIPALAVFAIAHKNLELGIWNLEFGKATHSNGE